MMMNQEQRDTIAAYLQWRQKEYPKLVEHSVNTYFSAITEALHRLADIQQSKKQPEPMLIDLATVKQVLKKHGLKLTGYETAYPRQWVVNEAALEASIREQNRQQSRRISEWARSRGY